MEARWDKRADGINTSIQHSTQLLQGLHFLKIQIKFADKEKKKSPSCGKVTFLLFWGGQSESCEISGLSHTCIPTAGKAITKVLFAFHISRGQ